MRRTLVGLVVAIVLLAVPLAASADTFLPLTLRNQLVDGPSGPTATVAGTMPTATSTPAETGCTSNCIAYQNGGDIFVVSPDGSGARNVTNNPATDQDPSWSPDGGSLALDSNRDAPAGVWTFDIYTVRLADSVVTRLTTAGYSCDYFPDTPDSNRTPEWSLSLNLIAFHGYRECDNDLYAVSPAGVETRVTYTYYNGTSKFDPAWSPDGRYIVYMGEDPDSSCWVLQRIAANGSAQTQLTSLAADYECVHTAGGGIRGDHNPAWSPTGSRIAFDSDERDSGHSVYVMNADGTGLRRLTDGQRPAWSPDGSRLAFDNGGRIYTIGANGGQASLVAQGSAPAW